MKNYNNEYKPEENTIKSIEEEKQSWTEFKGVEITSCILSAIDILSVIDDAQCYLFEFKVENHKIYYRQIQ